MNREYNVNSILEGLNTETSKNTINEATDMVQWYKDEFKKLDSSIDVISYEPSRLGNNTSTLVLQDKKSKNYFVYHMGATGYTTSVALVETPDSNKSIISHYIDYGDRDAEVVKFIAATRNYKKYAKSYETLKSELNKLYKAYSDTKALDPEGLFQNSDAKRGIFQSLATFFNDNRTKEYLK